MRANCKRTISISELNKFGQCEQIDCNAWFLILFFVIFLFDRWGQRVRAENEKNCKWLIIYYMFIFFNHNEQTEHNAIEISFFKQMISTTKFGFFVHRFMCEKEWIRGMHRNELVLLKRMRDVKDRNTMWYCVCMWFKYEINRSEKFWTIFLFA